ncbi:DEAD/DEAH box helicase family protein [bacterium]|nr:MAG: DEAD/DEAH box helicase family protein [bacterium]
MQDIKTYKQKDLVLKVNQNYDPTKLDLGAWDSFLDTLCVDREYQKEAIKHAVIFLASGRYVTTEDLVHENYNKNPELQEKYPTLSDYHHHLQLPNKLFANIDLATGTGKSYVIYGVAQIMLGLGLVDKVLVLCPSLTIEDGLLEKFEDLSGNARIKKSIPANALYKNPSIVDANITVKNGSICVENIHAVYETTGSSIKDSFQRQGERVLVLNDESHHIFNKISGNTTEAQGLKRWKEFLLNLDFNFRYILGFTGTAYHDNEYFNDVIYRYSLREAIEDRIVKNIEYVQKDDSSGTDEKFQKIYQNHKENIDKYPKIKPLSILITKDISKAKSLMEDLLDFLEKREGRPRESIEEKVLIVTSHKDHKGNLSKLKTVDHRENPTEWIVSVSMLTEGWDVKNVFQIVPWEDKAFNSKLLIAQVLGRGLRLPEAYTTPQPKIIVFNHDAWSRGIKALVDEVLEIETRIISEIVKNDDRSKYHFDVYNLDYTKEEVEVEHKPNPVVNYSRIEKEGIKLDSQVIQTEKGTSYESITAKDIREKNYVIEYGTWTVQEVVDRIYEEFEIRDWEGRILKLGEEQYTQNNLPPKEKIREIILKSMKNVGIKGDQIIEKNVNKILNTFATLLRKKSKTVVPQLKVNEPVVISTKNIIRESSGVGNFRRGYSLFYTNNWENEIFDDEQRNIMQKLKEDESFPKSADKEQNEFLFKTPVNVVFSNAEPERRFIENLCKKDIAEKIDAWLKSRDRGFYGIEYSWRPSNHQKIGMFNPDFFIKITKDNVDYFVVVEIKADKDDSDENKAKYKYAKEHFERLNNKLEENKIKQKYIFHFLSPEGYSTFFEYLKDGRILKGQEKFRCELENLLEELDDLE